jgi:Tfp pilus assembly protein PilE
MQSPKHTQRGFTLLQWLGILAVLGIVLTVVFNYLK